MKYGRQLIVIHHDKVIIIYMESTDLISETHMEDVPLRFKTSQETYFYFLYFHFQPLSLSLD